MLIRLSMLTNATYLNFPLTELICTRLAITRAKAHNGVTTSRSTRVCSGNIVSQLWKSTDTIIKYYTVIGGRCFCHDNAYGCNRLSWGFNVNGDLSIISRVIAKRTTEEKVKYMREANISLLQLLIIGVNIIHQLGEVIQKVK